MIAFSPAFTFSACLGLALLLPTPCAWSRSAAWMAAEHACVKLPTPEARAECHQKEVDAMKAFEQDRRRQENDKTSAKTNATAEEKRQQLCFRRRANGDLVCPN